MAFKQGGERSDSRLRNLNRLGDDGKNSPGFVQQQNQFSLLFCGLCGRNSPYKTFLAMAVSVILLCDRIFPTTSLFRGGNGRRMTSYKPHSDREKETLFCQMDQEHQALQSDG